MTRAGIIVLLAGLGVVGLASAAADAGTSFSFSISSGFGGHGVHRGYSGYDGGHSAPHHGPTYYGGPRYYHPAPRVYCPPPPVVYVCPPPVYPSYGYSSYNQYHSGITFGYSDRDDRRRSGRDNRSDLRFGSAFQSGSTTEPARRDVQRADEPSSPATTTTQWARPEAARLPTMAGLPALARPGTIGMGGTSTSWAGAAPGHARVAATGSNRGGSSAVMRSLAQNAAPAAQIQPSAPVRYVASTLAVPPAKGVAPAAPVQVSKPAVQTAQPTRLVAAHQGRTPR